MTGRPSKDGVDYFPHDVDHGKTMFILESHYGNDGYAFWFKLLEILGRAKGHFFDAQDPANWEFLTAKAKVARELATEILNTLSNLGAIDRPLWENKKVIWSQNLVERLEPVYRKRKVSVPEKPVFVTETTGETGIQTPENTQSKVKESKEKKRPPKSPLVMEQKPFFDAFYSVYPKKKSPADAEKAWGKINPDKALFDLIMNAVKRSCHSLEWKKDGGQFIPYPATWLNKRKWEDKDEISITEESHAGLCAECGKRPSKWSNLCDDCFKAKGY